MSRFWLLFLWPLISLPLTCGESVWYFSRRAEGLARIEEARQEIRETGEWATPEWWTYSQDWLDFRSDAWVTAIKGHGDCEDAVELARAILGEYETVRAYVKHQEWHAVLFWHTPSGWVTISNMHLLSFVTATVEELVWLLFDSTVEEVIWY